MSAICTTTQIWNTSSHAEEHAQIPTEPHGWSLAHILARVSYGMAHVTFHGCNDGATRSARGVRDGVASVARSLGHRRKNRFSILGMFLEIEIQWYKSRRYCRWAPVWSQLLNARWKSINFECVLMMYARIAMSKL